MPFTPEQEAQITAAIAKIPELATTIGTVAEQSKQALGFASRLDGEVKELKKAPAPDPKPPKPEEKDPTVSTLKAEIDAMKATAKDKDKQLAISQAMSGAKITWADPEYVQEKIAKLIEEVDGKYVVKAKEKLQATGAEIDVTLSPTEYLARFAKDRPGLVQTTAKNGAGAGGEVVKPGDRTEEEIFGTYTYAEILRDPKRTVAANRINPGRLSKLREDADRAKHKK